MRLLKETIELRADSEIEAKEIIENYRKEANEKGYTIGAAGYTYKTKKAKGEIVDEAWVCKIVMNFSGVWEE
jgi:hypothetical protein